MPRLNRHWEGGESVVVFCKLLGLGEGGRDDEDSVLGCGNLERCMPGAGCAEGRECTAGSHRQWEQVLSSSLEGIS